jgi:hypothetical protein
LNQIIDIACHQFDPTIAAPSKPGTLSSSPNLKIASALPSSGAYNLLKG